MLQHMQSTLRIVTVCKLKVYLKIPLKQLYYKYQGQACDLLHILTSLEVCQGLRERSHAFPGRACNC